MITQRHVSATLLAIALGFSPALSGEEQHQDLNALEAQQTELETQLQGLRNTQQHCGNQY